MNADKWILERGSRPLAFGCASLMRLSSGAERQSLLEHAYDSGIVHFDVARMYGLGQAEHELGRFLKGKRHDVVVASKFGIFVSRPVAALRRFQGPIRRTFEMVPAARNFARSRASHIEAPRRYDVRLARASLHASLRALSTDYVDLFLIHDPRPHDDVALAELTALLDGERSAGRILQYGLATDTGILSDELVDWLPDRTLQIREDVFSSGPLYTRPRLSFGAIEPAASRIVAATRTSGQAEAACRALLHGEAASQASLAGLLVAAVAQRNPQGKVIFSSVRPERLDAVLAAFDAPDLTVALQALFAMCESDTFPQS